MPVEDIVDETVADALDVIDKEAEVVPDDVAVIEAVLVALVVADNVAELEIDEVTDCSSVVEPVVDTELVALVDAVDVTVVETDADAVELSVAVAVVVKVLVPLNVPEVDPVEDAEPDKEVDPEVVADELMETELVDVRVDVADDVSVLLMDDDTDELAVMVAEVLPVKLMVEVPVLDPVSECDVEPVDEIELVAVLVWVLDGEVTSQPSKVPSTCLEISSLTAAANCAASVWFDSFTYI